MRCRAIRRGSGIAGNVSDIVKGPRLGGFGIFPDVDKRSAWAFSSGESIAMRRSTMKRNHITAQPKGQIWRPSSSPSGCVTRLDWIVRVSEGRPDLSHIDKELRLSRCSNPIDCRRGEDRFQRKTSHEFPRRFTPTLKFNLMKRLLKR